MAIPKKKVITVKKKTPGPLPDEKSTSGPLPETLNLKGKRLVRVSEAKSITGLKPMQTGAIISSRTTPVIDPDQERKFKFFCIWCAQKLSAYENWAGRELPCPSCHNIITIPGFPPKKADGN